MQCYFRGINYRTAPVEARERFALTSDEAGKLMRALQRAGAPEALTVSTCNRSEFYLAGLPIPQLKRILDSALSQFSGANVSAYWMELENRAAMSHLFRVASGLDSMLLGETEVLGQVKEAFQRARKIGAAGIFFNEVFNRALHAAKRVRSETAVGVGTVSLASIARGTLQRDLGDLSEKRVLLIGTGEIGEQVARCFVSGGAGRLTILSRTLARAERLAAEVGGEAADISQKCALFAASDGIVCASAAPYYLVRRGEAEASLRSRPVSMVDLSHPRNIDPEIREMENVRLYAMDDLRAEIDRNLERRRQELPAAEAIVQQETAQLSRWHAALPLAETVKQLRSRLEQVRQAELERVAGRLSEAEAQAVDEATRRILQKLLHDPTLALKSFDANDPSHAHKIALFRQIFGLKE